MAHAVAPIFQSGVLGPRDVIGLVNTNSMMCAYAVELIEDFGQLLGRCIKITAKNSLAMGYASVHFDFEAVHLGRLPPNTLKAGKLLSQEVNALIESGHQGSEEPSLLQARYSIRCFPQILGHCLSLLETAKKRVFEESVTVADNPLLTFDRRFFHGGLFYAIGISAACDVVSDSIYRLSEVMDRQVLTLMDSRLNGGLPDNLSSNNASHLKGVHQLTSALHQEVKALFSPSAEMTFSCEGNNQDVVPAGMTALNHLSRLLEVFGELISAAEFCSDRALYLADSKKELPERLHLNHFSEHTICRHNKR
jgi:histidine ammonia-lyase